MRIWIIFLASFCFAIAPLSANAQTDRPPPTAKLRQGNIVGSAEADLNAFRGIEYARAERWQLPTAPPSWLGTKPATAFGPSCPQAGQTEMKETCLFANVFSPASATPNERLPVVVWIHGGGFRAGSGGDGPRLWARQGIVVVTFNYRLGLLGFRDWAGWRATDPRNFGQADMVAALAWVKANIAAFGGDPTKVTLYGHSAGGMGVQLMMTDPRARGLFARAIADAGYADWPFPAAMNPSDEMRRRMKYPRLETNATPQELVARAPYFLLPYVGGSDLARQPSALFNAGRVARVPYLAGFNSFDGGSTLAGAGFDPDSFAALFAQPSALRSLYAADYAVSANQGAQRAFGDRRYGVSALGSVRAMARLGQPARLFLIDDHPADQLGAGHGSHVRALFGDEPNVLRPYFLSFIKTGRVSGAALPIWPTWTGQNGRWLLVGTQPSVVSDPTSGRLDRLKALPVVPEASFNIPSL